MAQIQPYIFLNFKGFAEKIRLSGKRSGAAMNPTVLELKDELDGIARAASATLTAVDLLREMLRLHKLEMDCSCSSEEKIIEDLWKNAPAFPTHNEVNNGQPA